MNIEFKERKEFITQISNLLQKNKLYEARKLLNLTQEYKNDKHIILFKIETLRGENPSILENLLNELLKLEESPWVLYQNFKFHQNQKNIKQTHIFKTKILSTIKESALDHCAHGFTYLLQGQKPKAETDFKEALEKDPTCIKAMLGLLKVYSDPEEKQEKLQWVKRVLEISPFNHDGLVGLLQIYMLNEEYDRALDTIGILKKECSPSKYVLYSEGRCYFCKGDYLKARDIFFSVRSAKCIGYNLDLQIGLTYLNDQLYKKVEWIYYL